MVADIHEAFTKEIASIVGKLIDQTIHLTLSLSLFSHRSSSVLVNLPRRVHDERNCTKEGRGKKRAKQGKIGREYTRCQLAVREHRLSGNRDNEVRGNQLSNEPGGWSPTQLFPNCIDVRTRWHTNAHASTKGNCSFVKAASKFPVISTLPPLTRGSARRKVALSARVLSRLTVINREQRTTDN